MFHLDQDRALINIPWAITKRPYSCVCSFFSLSLSPKNTASLKIHNFWLTIVYVSQKYQHFSELMFFMRSNNKLCGEERTGGRLMGDQSSVASLVSLRRKQKPHNCHISTLFINQIIRPALSSLLLLLEVRNCRAALVYMYRTAVGFWFGTATSWVRVLVLRRCQRRVENLWLFRMAARSIVLWPSSRTTKDPID